MIIVIYGCLAYKCFLTLTLNFILTMPYFDFIKPRTTLFVDSKRISITII
jgi:hypothetical protein